MGVFAMAVLCGTSVNEAIQSRGCGFSRTMDHADPETLVAEYVKRDANGEFMMMDLWFDTATLCPHHETVPDRASVISDSKITRASKTDSVETRVARCLRRARLKKNVKLSSQKLPSVGEY